MDVSNKLIYTLTEIAGILNTLKIKYCLIGGLAVSMLSKPRATEDVDFLILLEKDQKDHLLLEIEKKFQIIQNKDPFIFKNATIWRLIVKDKKSEDYDFAILDFLLADMEIYKNALNFPLIIKIYNREINVINIENLIKIKELSGRRIDILDVEELTKELNKK